MSSSTPAFAAGGVGPAFAAGAAGKSGGSCNFVESHLADYASETSSLHGSSSLKVKDELSAATRRPPNANPRSMVGAAGMESGVSGMGSWLGGLDAYSRHKMFINQYVISYGKDRVDRYLHKPTTGKTDMDILRENHQFIRDREKDDMSNWEVRMARKYYDKLFTEYCVADMSQYKKAKFGLRWRTQKEVFVGKGQFKCGNQACNNEQDLASFEMNFAYKENGELKHALVKLRVCPDCAIKLNYRKLKQADKDAKHARESDERQSKDKRGSKRKRAESTDDEQDDADAQHGDADTVWEAVSSKSTGKTYWYNKETGETSWKKPQAKMQTTGSVQPDDVGDEQDRQSNEARVDAVSGGSSGIGISGERDGGVGEGGQQREAKEEERRKMREEARKIWGPKSDASKQAASGEREHDGQQQASQDEEKKRMREEARRIWGPKSDANTTAAAQGADTAVQPSDEEERRRMRAEARRVWGPKSDAVPAQGGEAMRESGEQDTRKFREEARRVWGPKSDASKVCQERGRPAEAERDGASYGILREEGRGAGGRMRGNADGVAQDDFAQAFAGMFP